MGGTIISKHTDGCVSQDFDRDGNLTGQSFTAGDYVGWSTDIPEQNTDCAQPLKPPYHPFDMSQGGYAQLSWCIDDVTDEFDVTDEEARAFLERNRKKIRDLLCERGNEIIENLAESAGFKRC